VYPRPFSHCAARIRLSAGFLLFQAFSFFKRSYEIAIMLLHSLFFLALVALGGRALTISHRRSDLESPVVEIAYAAYQGALESNVQRFLGIPYAQPP